MADEPTRTPFLQWMGKRSVGDILVLVLSFTVCGMVVFAGIAVLILVLTRPGVDVAPVARGIGDVINTMIGLLAGFLAGRTDKVHAEVMKDTGETDGKKVSE